MNEVTTESIQKNISLVSQNDLLLANQSILENLIFLNPKASQHDIDTVCKVCKIYDKI